MSVFSLSLSPPLNPCFSALQTAGAPLVTKLVSESGYECQLPAALFTHPPLCTSVSTLSRHLHAFAYEVLTVMFYASISLISYFQYPRTAALLHTVSSDQSRFHTRYNMLRPQNIYFIYKSQIWILTHMHIDYIVRHFQHNCKCVTRLT